MFLFKIQNFLSYFGGYQKIELVFAREFTE